MMWQWNDFRRDQLHSWHLMWYLTSPCIHLHVLFIPHFLLTSSTPQRVAQYLRVVEQTKHNFYSGQDTNFTAQYQYENGWMTNYRKIDWLRSSRMPSKKSWLDTCVFFLWRWRRKRKRERDKGKKNAKTFGRTSSRINIFQNFSSLPAHSSGKRCSQTV
jgi:hypothetical protein